MSRQRITAKGIPETRRLFRWIGHTRRDATLHIECAPHDIVKFPDMMYLKHLDW